MYEFYFKRSLDLVTSKKKDKNLRFINTFEFFLVVDSSRRKSPQDNNMLLYLKESFELFKCYASMDIRIWTDNLLQIYYILMNLFKSYNKEGENFCKDFSFALETFAQCFSFAYTRRLLVEDRVKSQDNMEKRLEQTNLLLDKIREQMCNISANHLFYSHTLRVALLFIEIGTNLFFINTSEIFLHKKKQFSSNISRHVSPELDNFKIDDHYIDTYLELFEEITLKYQLVVFIFLFLF
jgi:hypothetical protein